MKEQNCRECGRSLPGYHHRNCSWHQVHALACLAHENHGFDEMTTCTCGGSKVVRPILLPGERPPIDPSGIGAAGEVVRYWSPSVAMEGRRLYNAVKDDAIFGTDEFGDGPSWAYSYAEYLAWAANHAPMMMREIADLREKLERATGASKREPLTVSAKAPSR